MKGPFGRLRFDVRRVWECPVCHRRDRTGGDIVTLICRRDRKAAGPDVWMKLHEGPDSGGQPATNRLPSPGAS